MSLERYATADIRGALSGAEDSLSNLYEFALQNQFPPDRSLAHNERCRLHDPPGRPTQILLPPRRLNAAWLVESHSLLSKPIARSILVRADRGSDGSEPIVVDQFDRLTADLQPLWSMETISAPMTKDQISASPNSCKVFVPLASTINLPRHLHCSFLQQLCSGVVGRRDAGLGDQSAAEDQGGQRQHGDPLAASDLQ